MTVKRHVCRAAMMQLAVSFLSCGIGHADIPEIPQLVLTADQVQISGETGIMIGMAAAFLVYLLIAIVLLVNVQLEVIQMRKLLGRVMEIDL